MEAFVKLSTNPKLPCIGLLTQKNLQAPERSEALIKAEQAEKLRNDAVKTAYLHYALFRTESEDNLDALLTTTLDEVERYLTGMDEAMFKHATDELAEILIEAADVFTQSGTRKARVREIVENELQKLKKVSG